MRSAFAETMLEIGLQNHNLVVLVGDISHGILQPFAKACPGRFYNVGICEPTMVNIAAGLALAGMFPVAHTITPFIIERAFEQIKLDFCYHNLGGTLISIGSAFDYAGLGCTHHCYNDFSLIKGLPNSQVIYPAMPNEFKILFRETYMNNQLTYFRLPSVKHEVKISGDEIQLGKGILIKIGKDITFVCVGPQLKTVIDSLPLLADHNIDSEVIYLPTIKPFDYSLVVQSIAKTRKVVVIEEHSEYGGISEDVMKAGLEVGGIKVDFISIPNRFLKGYGNYNEHCVTLGFTPQNIMEQACRIVA